MFRLSKYSNFLLVASIVLLNCLQSGIVIGWTSPILPIIESANSTIPTTISQGSWMANIVPLASVFFTPVAAISIHVLGRRISLLLTTLPFLISWIIIAIAESADVIIIGRAISGLGQSMSYTSVPIYLGETAPVQLRSSIGLCMTVANNIGMLWMYAIASEIELWISAVLNMIPLIVCILFCKFLPETPYYLLKKGKQDEAKEVLKILRKENVDEEYSVLEKSVESINFKESIKELYQDRKHHKALFVSVGMHFVSQFTGGVAFMYFAHTIFGKAGNFSPYILSLIKQVLQVLSVIFSAFIVGKTGNKPLLIISCIGSSVFMAAEGIYFYLHDSTAYNTDPIWWLPLVSMILFNMFQMIGIGPIPIAFMGELFHSSVKPVSVCISKIAMALFVFLVGEIFQLLMDGFGNCAPFFVFSVFGVVGVIFVYFCVPETRGRTLEEIQYFFKYGHYEN